MANIRFVKDYPALLKHRAEMDQARRRRRLVLVGGGLTGAGLAVSGFLISPPLGMLVGGISAMALFFASLSGGSTIPAHILTGIEGEVRGLRELKQLPDEYTLFNRVWIPDPWLPNGRRELDLVVVGPTGITVVEVKNTPGQIYIDPDQPKWRVARRGCGSSPNWNTMASPMDQVRAQVDALERWLLSQGVSLPVRAMVCFARSDVILQNVDGCPIPVVVPAQLKERIMAGQELASSAQREVAVRLLAGRRQAPEAAAA